MSKGDASVAAIILNSCHEGAGTLGFISAVPYLIHTSVKFHRNDPTANDANNENASTAVGRMKSFLTGKSMTNQGKGGAMNSGAQRLASDTAAKSFSQNMNKKVAVELFTEKRSADHMELILNNALALALNSKSSECVQVLLDAAAENKVSWGSYHAVTDMIPSLAVRYPYMCYGFLAGLSLQKVGDLEVPVQVIDAMQNSVIRTAPFFTNVKALWNSHLRLHEAKDNANEAYAHVDAMMARLPFACAIGKESLLQTLVESNVPVKAYGTPTVRAVIAHKWRLYGRTRLLIRAVVYAFYTTIFTFYAIIYAQSDRSLTLAQAHANSKWEIVHSAMGGYLILQVMPR